MGLKFRNIDFKQLESDRYLRYDSKYHLFISNTAWNIFNLEDVNNCITLNDILYESYSNFVFADDRDYNGITTGQDCIDIDGDISAVQIVNIDNCPNRLKYKIDNSHVLLSSIRLAKSPALNFKNIDNLEDYVFSNGYHIYKTHAGWDERFVMYILRLREIKDVINNSIYRGIGISAYKSSDLLKIIIPIINHKKQLDAISKIKNIETKIARIKSSIKCETDIINTVFDDYFNYDTERFNQLKQIKNYTANLSSLSNNLDVRNSVKFHRPAGEFVMEELTKLTNKRLKHFISEPIVLGKSISPNDYDESGDTCYLSMACIKDYYFDKDTSMFVNANYALANVSKMTKVNDIIMARSGEGTIGKVAIIEDSSKIIFADFTMRIRVDNANPTFVYYYMRTRYFQYLVEIHKKGLGNNTNIFPGQIQEFPMLDLSIVEQDEIISKIKVEITKQDEIKKQITKLRKEIDDIIYDTIR